MRGSHPEKRRAPRVRHDSVVDLYDRTGRRLIGTGRLVNFSTVGACFSSTQLFKTGETLQAKVRLLKEGRLQVSGPIVWTRKKPNHYLYGLAFDRVSRVRA
jgi:hypothetical protein